MEGWNLSESVSQNRCFSLNLKKLNLLISTKEFRFKQQFQSEWISNKK